MSRPVLLAAGVALSAVIPWAGAVGQAADTLHALKTPVSPAFILLGVAPTTIERLTTPRAIAVSLAGAVQDPDFPPKHYAVEFAPYWLTPHRTLTFDDYAAPGFWQSLKQTLSVSVATSLLAAADSGTALGFGLRTAYMSGRDLTKLRPLRDTLAQIQAGILRATTNEEEQRLAAQAQPVALRIQETLRTERERLGFTVEVATALVMDFPGDIAENGRLGKAGVWVTTGYRILKPAVDLLTVVRLTQDARPAADERHLDLGFRLLVDRADLTLAAEYVYRGVTVTGGASRNTYHLSANAQYRFTTSIYVTAAVGRDHKETETGASKFIAQVAIDFGMGPLPLLGK